MNRSTTYLTLGFLALTAVRCSGGSPYQAPFDPPGLEGFAVVNLALASPFDKLYLLEADGTVRSGSMKNVAAGFSVVDGIRGAKQFAVEQPPFSQPCAVLDDGMVACARDVPTQGRWNSPPLRRSSPETALLRGDERRVGAVR